MTIRVIFSLRPETGAGIAQNQSLESRAREPV
jgi:hypothetical protein